jgi:hypothetical protein
MVLCSTIVTRYALCRGQQWFGAGYHMIYAHAAYVVTFAWLYSYGKSVLQWYTCTRFALVITACPCLQDICILAYGTYTVAHISFKILHLDIFKRLLI